MNLLLRLSIRYHRLFKQYTYFNKKSFINESSLMKDFNYSLTVKSLSAFKITIIAAPVSLKTAIHNVSHPGKIKIKAANLIIRSNQIFFLIIILAFLLNFIV